jgi:hypothetical protein
MNRYVLAFLIGIVAPMTAAADDSLAKFRGGIGVLPVSSGTGDVTPPNPNQNANVNRNVVRGVQPAGQIWVIEDLRADVREDGRIRVEGRGLLLGGGNNIGFTNNVRVFATLICGAAAPFTEHSTNAAGVAVEPDGDFRIDDALDTVPASCASPVLLIRNANGRAWFAAGIPDR